MNLTDTSGLLAALGRVSAQAGVLVLLILVVQWLFRKQLTPRWRCALWMLVMARLLLPVSFASVVSLFNLAPHWAAPGPPPAIQSLATPAAMPEPPRTIASTPTTEVRAGRDSTPATEGSTRPDLAANDPGPGPAVLGPAPIAETRRISWPAIAFAIWLAGALALSTYVLVGSIRVSRRLAGLPPITDSAVLNAVKECREWMDVRQELVVVESPMVCSPALHGFFRPRLVLPRGFIGAFSQGELRFVLLHELAHVKRRDILMNWLVAVLQIVHWFNPLVWLGFSRWRADRELACDALALEVAGPEQNQEYGKTILRLLEGFTHRVAAPGLVGILEDKNQLRRRIGMIAAYVPARRWSIPAVVLMIALAITCLTDAQNQTAIADKPKDQNQSPAVAEVQSPATSTPSAPSRRQITNGPSVKVTVLDAETGKPLADAEVLAPNFASFFRGLDVSPQWVTDENGVALIRLGEPPQNTSQAMTWFTVSVRHKGYSPEGQSWSAEKSDVRAMVPGEITARLKRGSSIGGVVRDDQGAPLPGVGVRIYARGYSYKRYTFHQEYAEFWSDGAVPLAVTDTSGRWRAEDFPLGDLENVLIDLTRPDGSVEKFKYEIPGRDTFINEFAAEPFDLAELRAGQAPFVLKPGITLTGVVVDPQGRPVPSVLIKTGYGVGNRERGTEIRTGPDGRFKLEHLAKRQMILTAYPDHFAITSAIADLTTNSGTVQMRQGNSTVTVQMRPPARSSEIRLKLAPLCPLTIRVVDGSEKPIAGARVDVDEYRTGAHLLDFKGATDANGILIWSNAPVSDFALTAMSPNSPLRQLIRITPAQKAVTFRLRQGMDKDVLVRGSVKDARTGQEIKLESVKYQTGDREGFRGDNEIEPRTNRGVTRAITGTNAIEIPSVGDGAGMTHWTVDGVNDAQWFWYRASTNAAFGLIVSEKRFRPGVMPIYQLELKADGYETLITPWRDFDEGDWAPELILQPVATAQRSVLLPNGQPAAGTTAWARLATTDGALFCNDANRYYGDRLIKKETDGRGQLGTLSVPGDQPVIFTHPNGFLELTGAEFKSSSKIQLQPWGRVDGVLKVAGKPKRDVQVMIASEWRPDVGFHLLWTTVTAPDGSFVFANVPAGNYRLFRRENRQTGTITEDHQMPLALKPGEHLKVEYAGTGRAVIGQATADNPDLAVNWLNDDHTLTLKQPPLREINREDFATAEAFTKAYHASFIAPERLKQTRAARTYVLNFEQDGSFRADDVPPGTYELSIRVTKPREDSQAGFPGAGDSLGFIVREIVVPDGKEPFELGSLVVSIKNDGSPVKKTPPLDLAVQTFEGRSLGLADFRGKNLLLVFWAAWSDRSTEQLADFQKLHAEFAKDQRLAMLSVNMDDNLDAARQAVNARHYQWPQAWANPENRVRNGASFDVNSLPTVLLLDPQGRIVGRDLQGDRLYAAVKRALAKN